MSNYHDTSLINNLHNKMYIRVYQMSKNIISPYSISKVSLFL